jgi:hypothetical protein
LLLEPVFTIAVTCNAVLASRYSSTNPARRWPREAKRAAAAIGTHCSGSLAARLDHRFAAPAEPVSAPSVFAR